MTMMEVPLGAAWTDRFTRPEPDRLHSELEPEHSQAVSAALEMLENLGLGTRLEWHGPSWRWCFACYSPKGDDSKAVAYVVPRPGRPMVCAPVSVTRLDKIECSKLQRPVREGVTRATLVGRVAWCSWPVANNAASESAVAFIAEAIGMTAR